MPERAKLLHNMSAPPKSVVKYSGLADLTTTSGPGGSGVCGVRLSNAGVFGIAVRIALPVGFSGTTSTQILRQFGHEPLADPDRQLVDLINARADTLPLPDGCLVIKSSESHHLIWNDVLSALAVITKSSDCIWLRAKTPSLSALIGRRQLSLLVPPLFVDRLSGGPQ
jgi:hypothetical protein